jgi:hypothetical protein
MTTATEQAIVTYVTYLYPGLIVSEESTHRADSRDPVRAAREASRHAYAFRFHEVLATVATLGAEDVEMCSSPRNHSGWYYIDGEDLTAAEVADLPGDHRVLLDNMRINGWRRMVHCRAGNWLPMASGDLVISSGTGE